MPDILIVDDDPNAIHVLGRMLENVGHVRFAMCGTDALHLTQAAVPDLILLDAEMPGLSGFATCAALKNDPRFVDVPIVFVTAHADESFELAGFDAGAADFITKPIIPRLVLARVTAQLRVKQMADELRRSAGIDALTGVANRRRFDSTFEQEWLRARRARTPLALMLVDVDHFKRYNDHYGHVGGDACLRALADTLRRASLRPADLVARWGGEEFMVLLPETPSNGAARVARRLLGLIDTLALPHEASPTGAHVTVSAGIACYGAAGSGWRQAPSSMIEAADRALYAAKSAGRAQICLTELGDEDRNAGGFAGSFRHIARSLVPPTS